MASARCSSGRPPASGCAEPQLPGWAPPPAPACPMPCRRHLPGPTGLILRNTRGPWRDPRRAVAPAYIPPWTPKPGSPFCPLKPRGPSCTLLNPRGSGGCGGVSHLLLSPPCPRGRGWARTPEHPLPSPASHHTTPPAICLNPRRNPRGKSPPIPSKAHGWGSHSSAAPTASSPRSGEGGRGPGGAAVAVAGGDPRPWAAVPAPLSGTARCCPLVSSADAAPRSPGWPRSRS